MVKLMHDVWVRPFAIAIFVPAVASAQTTAPATPAPMPAPAPVSQAQPAPPIDRYVVGQAKPAEIPGTTLLDLTLEQAIQMALDKNLGLQAARMNPQLTDYQL